MGRQVCFNRLNQALNDLPRNSFAHSYLLETIDERFRNNALFNQLATSGVQAEILIVTAPDEVEVVIAFAAGSIEIEHLFRRQSLQLA